jgi:hypothetical protein
VRSAPKRSAIQRPGRSPSRLTEATPAPGTQSARECGALLLLLEWHPDAAPTATQLVQEVAVIHATGAVLAAWL